MSYPSKRLALSEVPVDVYYRVFWDCKGPFCQVEIEGVEFPGDHGDKYVEAEEFAPRRLGYWRAEIESALMANAREAQAQQVAA